ncbi:MAG: hypothetical protein ABI036_09835 [Fibrobacteria bacterium]
MKKQPEHSRNPGMSLIQANDGRQVMLEKMRGKLAGTSQFQAEFQERRRVSARKSALGWGWKLGLFAIIAAGNIYWLSSHTQVKAAAVRPHAATLQPPSAQLSVDDQALYWTYAIYDFHKLTAKFGVAKDVVINSRQAETNLRDLFPKVNPYTRFEIERYIPVSKRPVR